MLCTKPVEVRMASSVVAVSCAWYLGWSSVSGTPVFCRCPVASASNFSPVAAPFFDAAQTRARF